MKETLIGKNVKIIDTSNPCLKGMEGKVIDETKNTITITKNNSEKKLIKNQITIEVDGKKVEGNQLTKRVEERIKR